MIRGIARRIVKDIHTDECDPEEKLIAIQEEIVDAESHGSVTKQDLVEVIRWLVEEYI